MKRLLLAAAALLLLGVGCPLWPIKPVTTEPIAQPVPPPAPDPDGPAAKVDLIRVDIDPGDAIASPLTLTGEARGTWYFEASFPIHLYDADGKELAVAVAQAQSEWMTAEFVPFRAEMTFAKPATATGTLIFRKDNPSGLPEHDDELRIAVKFAATGGSVTADGCKRTGCSGQVCADEDVITTCEYRPEYACYKDAACERQADGKCGWTPSAPLTVCLDAATAE